MTNVDKKRKESELKNEAPKRRVFHLDSDRLFDTAVATMQVSLSLYPRPAD